MAKGTCKWTFITNDATGKAPDPEDVLHVVPSLWAVSLNSLSSVLNWGPEMRRRKGKWDSVHEEDVH